MSKIHISFWAGLILTCLLTSGCQSEAKVDAAAAAPPPAKVVEEPDLSQVRVDRPERFKLVAVERKEELPEIKATGSITPDIEKSIPVVSLASGRVLDIRVRVGDDVKKGQLLLRILSNDLTNGYQTYAQAKADQQLAQRQLERAKLLYDHGAASLNDLQIAEDTEAKARVTVKASAQTIRTLGGEPEQDSSVLNVYAPASGTLVEQNIAVAGAVGGSSQTPNLFTIADLSTVWVMCDVYENDLPAVRVGDRANITMNAYPDRVLHGTIGNIGKVLDPNLRTAKVRIQVANPGMMRAGMFVTATFFGQHGRTFASVPTTAVIRLHDRDWVFVPGTNGMFRRQEITGGKITDNHQEVQAGLRPGQEVVEDALALKAESDQ